MCADRSLPGFQAHPSLDQNNREGDMSKLHNLSLGMSLAVFTLAAALPAPARADGFIRRLR